MSNVYLQGMHGLGDNLHQRAIVQQLLRTRHRVWLETPWPCVYHDLASPNLHLLSKGSKLRTQAKNSRREAARYSRIPPPPGLHPQQLWYRPEAVRRTGSVLAALCESAGLPPADFGLHIPDTWRSKAVNLIAQWRTGKPLLIVRPLVERSEWSGCPARNPDHAAYAALVHALTPHFFTVSVADLEAGAEWIAGEPLAVDVEYHHGELSFEVLAALMQQAALVVSSPGFAVVLAQAVGTPVACVFGGYEDGRSFSGGAGQAPYLAIEPLRPCACFSHHHACDKRIDLPAAHAALQTFAHAATHRHHIAR